MNIELPPPEVFSFGSYQYAVSTCENRGKFFASPAEAERLQREIQSYSAERAVKLLSIDVFDTLLLRGTDSEAQRFLDVSKYVQEFLRREGTPAPSHWDLLVSRFQAMEVSYELSRELEGCREGRLRDIIALQVDSLGLSKSIVDGMLECEIAYEAEKLKPNFALLRAAAEKAASGCAVILLSDMYMSASEMQMLCERLLPDSSFITEIISIADVTLSKRSGKIFGHVSARYGLEAADILHIGDDVHSDFRMALHNGWRALHIPICDVELKARQMSLERLLQEAHSAGLDVSSWAKR